ncbi:Probable alpha-glucosidase Os06g0675700 [Aduncisulcus paluster]|uniref:Maltase n=1 Tax=Aduncisulcus paluster TaxID=2918883 RepID=A0ABQ5KRY2_9EUKA|nr:Probable alpha-glucosidase Os06g0675700 [Aduncisulcus paluster]
MLKVQLLLTLCVLSFVSFCYSSYLVNTITDSADGFDIDLTLYEAAEETYCDDIPNLTVSVEFLDLRSNSITTHPQNSILKISITDKDDPGRFAIPKTGGVFPSTSQVIPSSSPSTHKWKVPKPTANSMFDLSLYLRGNSTLGTSDFLSHTMSNLVYQDCYLSVRIPTAPSPDGSVALYGLGDRATSLRRDLGTYSMWNHDPTGGVADDGSNGYSNLPIMFFIEDDSAENFLSPAVSTGLFLLNASATDIVFYDDGTDGNGSNDDSDSYSSGVEIRSTAGILEFYFMAGQTPDYAMAQYHQLVGYPVAPPIWAIGFQNSRWGLDTLEKVIQVVQNYQDRDIPIDAQHFDIDVLGGGGDGHRDFTVNDETFPHDDFKEFLEDLQDNGTHAVVIVDPVIAADSTFDQFNELVESGAYIKCPATDDPYIGKQWPGRSIYPDFMNEDSFDFWETQFSNYISDWNWDGFIIDENDVKNDLNDEPEVDPRCYSLDSGEEYIQTDSMRQIDYPFNLNKPPYTPQDGTNLATRTIDNRTTSGMGEMFDVHNLYGLYEGQVTRKALNTIDSTKRWYIQSRTVYPGSGKNTQNWSGDNHSTLNQMMRSISMLLTSNIEGISLSGSDIGGYQGDCDEDLLSLWLPLGMVYTMSRQHRQKQSDDNYCWVHSELVCDIQRAAIKRKYSYIAQMYSSLLFSSLKGGPAVKPLFVLWPDVADLLDIDTQLMIGDSIMAAPLVEMPYSNDSTQSLGLDVVFPTVISDTVTISSYTRERWYYYDYPHEEIILDLVKASTTNHITADAGDLPLFLRGGKITMYQEALDNVTETYLNSHIELRIAINDVSIAMGEFILDKGDSALPVSDFVRYYIKATTGKITGVLEQSAYVYPGHICDSIVMIGSGVSSSCSLQATLNGEQISAKNEDDLLTFDVSGLRFNADFDIEYNCV